MIRRDTGRSTVALSIGATVASGLPVFLVGALFVQISADLDVPDWALGVIVAVFWIAAALGSNSSGLLTAKIGSRRVVILTFLVAAASLLAAALLTPRWEWLILWTILGGISTSLCHPATNHLLRLRVSEGRRALAYGLKQSAVPLASLLAGLAIPFLALTLGWRSAYVLAAVLAVALLGLFLVIGPKRLPKGTKRVSSSVPLTRSQKIFFLSLASATLLGAGAATSGATFGVVSAVERGMDAGTAGFVLSAASLVGAIVRVGAGALADRRPGNPVRWIAAMQLIGFVGGAVMIFSSGVMFAVGLALVMGIGWGWTGLGHFIVARLAGPATPSATALVQTGSYAGCAIAPVLGGIIYANGGSTPVWIMVAAMFLVAGVIALVVSRQTRPAAA